VKIYYSHLEDNRIKDVFMYILTGGVNPSSSQEPPQPEEVYIIAKEI
jgi:hypothetical protein